MKIVILLLAVSVIQISAEECVGKRKVKLDKDITMQCRGGIWKAVQRKSALASKPCEDNAELSANGTCSADRGHCQQFTQKGSEMDRSCPGTCDSCDACKCQDSHQWHQYCSYWQQYCHEPGVLGNWMNSNCRKTCGNCRCPCCSFNGAQHALGARISLPKQCGVLECQESLIAGDSPLLPGAKKHHVSHPEELTLNFLSLHEGADCCILPEKAMGADGTQYDKDAMVEEGWGGSIMMPGGPVQAHCCHGTLSVALEDAESHPSFETKTTSMSTSPYSPGCGPEDRSVVSGDTYPDGRFPVDKLFTVSKKERTGTYWLGGDSQAATFIINLGCQLRFKGIQLVNTHNESARDRSTKKFRLSVSQSQAGPWQFASVINLEDSRQQNDPLPLQLIDLQAEVTGQFLKFELLGWYGHGGGLQYFDIQRGQ